MEERKKKRKERRRNRQRESVCHAIFVVGPLVCGNAAGWSGARFLPRHSFARISRRNMFWEINKPGCRQGKLAQGADGLKLYWIVGSVTDTVVCMFSFCLCDLTWLKPEPQDLCCVCIHWMPEGEVQRSLLTLASVSGFTV